jgi:hypothetical protein
LGAEIGEQHEKGKQGNEYKSGVKIDGVFGTFLVFVFQFDIVILFQDRILIRFSAISALDMGEFSTGGEEGNIEKMVIGFFDFYFQVQSTAMGTGMRVIRVFFNDETAFAVEEEHGGA